MKAAYIEQPGPAEHIRFGDLPLPTVHKHEVLVRMIAVTVDHVDTYIRSGAFPIEMPSPFIIGRDMVGVVEAIGAGVQQFKVGERVWSNCLGIDGQQGTFAEYLAVPENRLFSLPEGIKPYEAVAAVHSALAALIGLFTKAQLTAGDTLFINGGSGSVGLAILQIAKACGARVAATAGNKEKAKWCQKMGADRVVDYHTEHIPEAIRDFSPSGVDIFWETTPALDLEQVLPAMAAHGRIIIIAGREEWCGTFPVKSFYTHNCSLHGFIVTGTSVEKLRHYARQINAWLAKGTLKTKIQAIMPLSEAAQAHKLQEQGKLFGKIVLVPDQ